jgi:hypothetical protein
MTTRHSNNRNNTMKLVAYAMMLVLLIPTFKLAGQVIGSFKEAANQMDLNNEAP